MSAPRKVENMALALALLAGLVHRLVFGWFAPFWLDEAYTGVIASQESPAGLLRWCRQELSGPFYYSAIWLWERAAGDSNLALRLPSLLASLGAVALAAAFGGRDRRERWLWAGMMAVWLPGLPFAAQARPQALLFLLATAQAITFLRCIDTRSPRWLTIWAAMGALMILTHIHAAAITGLQLLCVLWIVRPRFREAWPALMIFACVAAWLPLQLSFVAGMLKPGLAWQPLLEAADLLKLPYHLFAVNIASFAVVAIVVLILGSQYAKRRSAGVPLPYSRGEAMLALSGLASVCLVIAAGFLRPSFEPRYLIPYMPAVLFGLMIVLSRASLLLGLLPSIVLAAWAGAAMQNMASFASADAQQDLSPLEFERGSAWLMDRRARRVMFVWDNPTSALSGAAMQSEVGAFFFRRAGYAAEVRAVFVPKDEQTSANLAALADRNQSAILWVGGATYPAGLRELQRFDCSDFGGPTSRSMACIRP